MEGLTLVFAVISAITTILSITFAILAFARNKGTDGKSMENRLTKMEVDILYIRTAIDKQDEWKQHIEHRLLKLERSSDKRC